MFDPIRQTWSRHAVGYRQGELDDGDVVATMVVTLIGGPAFLVGMLLLTADGLDIGQVLLVAPVAALLGGALIGSSASIAARTGGTGRWLLRPPFGRAGSVMVSAVRLALVAVWTVIGLRLAGQWLTAAATQTGWEGFDDWIGIGVVALLGLGLTFLGMVSTIKRVIRKPLFIASVLLIGLLGWHLAAEGAGFGGGGGGSFWQGVQRAVEMAVVFVPFVQVVARRLRNEDEAAASFGVGYAVPATLMLVAGGVVAFRAGGMPGDLTALGIGAAGLTLAITWVVLAELDQAFSGFVASGAEAVGVLGVGSPVAIGLLAVGAVVAGAALSPVLPVDWATLLAAVAFPAAVISAVDFHVARPHQYAEEDLYGSGDMQGMINVAGVTCWVLAVAFGQLMAPVGPSVWMGAVPVIDIDPDVPWRLVMALVWGAAYVGLVRWRDRRRSAVYRLRGI